MTLNSPAEKLNFATLVWELVEKGSEFGILNTHFEGLDHNNEAFNARLGRINTLINNIPRISPYEKEGIITLFTTSNPTPEQYQRAIDLLKTINEENCSGIDNRYLDDALRLFERRLNIGEDIDRSWETIQDHVLGVFARNTAEQTTGRQALLTPMPIYEEEEVQAICTTPYDIFRSAAENIANARSSAESAFLNATKTVTKFVDNLSTVTQNIVKQIIMNNKTKITITDKDINDSGIITSDIKAQILILIDCSKLKTLPEFPAGLEHFHLNNCSKLKTLPAFPAGLKGFDLLGCSKLKTLPAFPAGLEHFYLNNCIKLKTLPAFPVGLKTLDLTGYRKLKILSGLPDGLENLYLNDCIKLNILILPEKLKRLDLRGCNALQPTEDLIKKLQKLEDNECRVHYPSHFFTSQKSLELKTKLENAIDRFCQTNPTEHPKIKSGAYQNPPQFTKTLLDRFLSEGISQRGTGSQNDTMEELLKTVDPFISLLEQNPEHLRWMEEISKVSLDGCVNQPVAGVAEISSWVGIINAKSMIDKTEALKQLFTIRMIPSLVKKYKVPEGFEVEAGNILLREVHNKLLENNYITTPWIGVPGKIAYEAHARNWITEDKINQAFTEIKEQVISKNPVETIAALYTTDLFEIWTKVNFPNEIKTIETKYAPRQAIISELMALKDDPNNKEIAENLEKITKNNITLKNYYDSLKQFDAEALGRSYNDNKNKMEKEIAQMATTKTDNGIKPSTRPQFPSVVVPPLDFSRLSSWGRGK